MDVFQAFQRENVLGSSNGGVSGVSNGRVPDVLRKWKRFRHLKRKCFSIFEMETFRAFQMEVYQKC